MPSKTVSINEVRRWSDCSSFLIFGRLYLLANEYTDSLKHMEIANTIYRKRSGKKSIEVADIAVALASAYAAEGDDCKADTYFKEALGLYKALPNDSCEEQ